MSHRSIACKIYGVTLFFFVLRIKLQRDIIVENGQSVNERERDGGLEERERKHFIKNGEILRTTHAHTSIYIS